MFKLLRHVVASFLKEKNPTSKFLSEGEGVAAGVVYL